MERHSLLRQRGTDRLHELPFSYFSCRKPNFDFLSPYPSCFSFPHWFFFFLFFFPRGGGGWEGGEGFYAGLKVFF